MPLDRLRGQWVSLNSNGVDSGYPSSRPEGISPPVAKEDFTAEAAEKRGVRGVDENAIGEMILALTSASSAVLRDLGGKYSSMLVSAVAREPGSRQASGISN